MNEIVIPEGTTEINDKTFENHRSVTGVIIPEGVLVIRDHAFANCINLKNIKLPDSIMAIGKNAFENCISLESIEIPKGIKTIEDACFAGCEMLESLILPETLTQIKHDAFAGCTGIKNLVIPDNLTSCSSSAFPNSKKYLPVNKFYSYENGMMINTYNSMLLFYDGKDKVAVTPSNVKGIANRAFCHCKAEQIRITPNITSIGDEAFLDAKHKLSIFIPESVDYIESSAFDENVKIYCSKGSYAENWCRNGNFVQLEDETL